MSAWKFLLNSLVDNRTSMKDHLMMQLQVREKLCNMMQREDTSKARELAEESRKIAARALEDSQVMKAVALNSRKIAEATRYAFRAERSSLFGSSPSSQLPKSIPGTAQTADGFDPDRIGSFAMKTIAILTMLFIPGTAIATIFSMGSFLEGGPDGTGDKFVVSTKVWIYLAVAGPITILVLLFWANRATNSKA
ncbi:hypothetical protein BKA64DRAFT_708819 [Cadophora sp. MPI-SDFR-AT-0126]|nr:hypothetical protein BKA64DRAFT_708819 [Leotiomycetes sp. MPI-SDFR-AT-0126]